MIAPILAAVYLAALAHPAPAAAAAQCDPTDWRIAATSSIVTTNWVASCNTAWNMTLILQYQDANGWHNAGCTAALNDCKRQKPNDGSWFQADSTHTSQDDWNVDKPASICTHPFRLRMNFHFFSGAGGITFNGDPDNHPCTTAP